MSFPPKSVRLACALLCAIGAALPATAAASHEYVVTRAPALADSAARDAIAAAGGRVTRDLHIIDGYGARLSRPAAARLRRTAGVAAVVRNARMSTSAATTSTALSGSTLLTAFNQSLGTDRVWTSATGKNVGVAVIDTGIAGSLTDFRSSQKDATSRVVASVVTNPQATTAGDSYGHGTHVAGLIAGNGFYRPTTDPLFGKYAGTAPDAKLISIKASDEDGNATVLDVIYGLQFAVDNRAVGAARPARRCRRGGLAARSRRRRRRRQPRHRGRLGLLRARQRPVRHQHRRGRRPRHEEHEGRPARELVEPGHDAGRFQEARGARARRPSRQRAGPRQ